MNETERLEMIDWLCTFSPQSLSHMYNLLYRMSDMVCFSDVSDPLYDLMEMVANVTMGQLSDE